MAYDYLIKADSTSQMIEVFLRSDTTGQGVGSLAHTDVTAKYHRQGAAAATAISLSAGTPGTFSSGGWVAAGSGTTGTYQFGVPDAALAAGVGAVKITLTADGAIDKEVNIVLIGQVNAPPVQDAAGGVVSSPMGTVYGTCPDVPDWAETTEYDVGDLVIGDSNLVQCGTAHTTITIAPWDSGTEYLGGEVVSYDGKYYVSILTGTNQTPAFGSQYWSEHTTAFNAVTSGYGPNGGYWTAAALTVAPLAVAGAYTGRPILITGGTGAGQLTRIAAMIGSVATVCPSWTTQPDDTSTYAILPAIVPTLSAAGSALAVGDLTDTSIAGVLTAQGYTVARGGYLEKLGFVGTLVNLITTGATASFVAQGYTTTRAPYLDKLNVTGALAHTDNASSFMADVSGLMTADAEVETGIELLQALQVILAAVAGKADGLDGTTVHFRDQADTKNRITATVDSHGNRTSVTLSPD